jgi:hypothetical protein
LALLSQRSRWWPAATRKPRLRLLRLPTPLLLPLLLRLLTLLLRLLRLTLLLRLLRLRLLRRTDPTGSGMKARAGREPVCTGFRVLWHGDQCPRYQRLAR